MQTEIRNIRRYPGWEKNTENTITVTVLFSNSTTPDRLAQKAEDENDLFSVAFQRTQGIGTKSL